jgi:bifunctional non-homologous end joining protein LigD
MTGRSRQKPVRGIPAVKTPMLATLVAEPFDQPGWTYEEKYDGDRLLAYKEGARVRLVSRNGKGRTDKFPAIVEAIRQLPSQSLLLDGEVAVFDRAGISHFQALQKGSGRPVYAVFDCLYRDGTDLRARPLVERRAALEKAIKGNGVLRLSRILSANGMDAFRKAKRTGFEGLVAKDLSSPYVEGRSRYWLKVKIHREDEFIILGFTPPEGEREYFGALLLGTYVNRKLTYVGRVGTGFDRKTLATLYRKFRPLVTPKLELTEPPPGKGLTFLKPELVAQISYQEITVDRKLRQPVFLGLRDDKAAREVTWPSASQASGATPSVRLP